MVGQRSPPQRLVEEPAVADVEAPAHAERPLPRPVRPEHRVSAPLPAGPVVEYGVEGSQQAEAPFEEQLLTACQQIHLYFETRWQTFRLMRGAEDGLPWPKGRFRERFKAHQDRPGAVMAGIIERGVTEGKVRCDIPPAVLARMLAGMQRGWARGRDDAAAPAGNVERVVQIFCRGVAPSD